MDSEASRHFRAFEVLAEERLMHGFLRVARLSLMGGAELRKKGGFAQPMDVGFGKAMVKTLGHLLGVFSEVIFGIADQDEISLVLTGGGREAVDPRELVARLAGEASGKLSRLVGGTAAFDVRVYEFPSSELVRRYFVWRRAENERRVLDAYFRHIMESKGTGRRELDEMVASFGWDEKLEILRQNEVEFHHLPSWQRYGVGAYWQGGVDGAEPTIIVETELPEGEAFKEYIARYV